MSAGRKDDDSKLRLDLLPVAVLRRIAEVLAFGAAKYGADNWRYVDDGRRRYYAAALRHLTAWWGGERCDAESGLTHLAHAACCLLFLIWLEEGQK